MRGSEYFLYLFSGMTFNGARRLGEVGLRGRKFKTEADVERHRKKGFGGGVGASYVPWLRVQDVPSQGRSHRIPGLKFDRVHHLLSDLERAYYLACEFSDDVIDIREQYPLFPREKTQAIASSEGIRHPVYPGSSVPLVMTTDFLLTIRQLDGSEKLVARSVKYTKELAGKDSLRALEKLKIEKLFWNNQGVDWNIVTEEMFTPDLVKNLGLIRNYSNLPRALLQQSLQADFIQLLVEYRPYPLDAAECLRKIASRMHITYPDAKNIFLYLVWNKRLIFDLTKAPIQMQSPIPNFEVYEDDSGVQTSAGVAI